MTSAQRADEAIRATVKRSSRTRYWSAYLESGGVYLGRPLTYAEAVREVAAGRSVFAVTQGEAAAVASAAGGNRSPVYHPRHRCATGYYNHYHIGGYGKGHVWFLF